MNMHKKKKKKKKNGKNIVQKKEKNIHAYVLLKFLTKRSTSKCLEPSVRGDLTLQKFWASVGNQEKKYKVEQSGCFQRLEINSSTIGFMLSRIC